MSTREDDPKLESQEDPPFAGASVAVAMDELQLAFAKDCEVAATMRAASEEKAARAKAAVRAADEAVLKAFGEYQLAFAMTPNLGPSPLRDFPPYGERIAMREAYALQERLRIAFLEAMLALCEASGRSFEKLARKKGAAQS